MTKISTADILSALQNGERTLAYLNSCSTKNIPDDIGAKIHSTASSCLTLQAGILKSGMKRSKKLNELWEGLIVLEHMFGNYIKHFNEINQLACSICTEMFPVSRDALRRHLEGNKHISRYSKNVLNDLDEYWKVEVGECFMLKYGNLVDFEGPNGKLFCKVCCVEVVKDKLELFRHFKAKRHKLLFENFVSAITNTGNDSNNMPDVFIFSASSNETVLNNDDFGFGSSASSSLHRTIPNRPNRPDYSRSSHSASDSHSMPNSTSVPNSGNAFTFPSAAGPSSMPYASRSPLVSNSSGPSSMPNASGSSTLPKTKRRSFMRKLVEDHVTRSAQESTTDMNRDECQRNSDNHPNINDNNNINCIRDRPIEVTNTRNHSTFNSSGPSSMPNASGSSTLPEMKRRSFIRKLVEDHDTSSAQESTTDLNRDECQRNGENRAINRNHSTFEHGTIRFGPLNMLPKMRSIGNPKLIVPIGLTDIPEDAPDVELIEAVEHLGVVKHIHRCEINTNVIIFIQLFERYQNIFRLEKTIIFRHKLVDILNPFLYP